MNLNRIPPASQNVRSRHAACRALGSIAATVVMTGALLISEAATIPPAERLLPGDTLFVATVPDFAKLNELRMNQPQAQFWDDAAIKPFREKFMEKLRQEILEPLEREIDVPLTNFSRLPQGQLTFAVLPPGADQEPGFVLLMDARHEGNLLKTNLAAMKRKWLDSGKSMKNETVRGIEFSVIPLNSGDLPEFLNRFSDAAAEEDEEDEDASSEAPSAELAIGQYESMLIVGNSTKAVEQIALRLTGGSAPLLADQAAFESSRNAAFRESPVYAWLNTRSMLQLLVRKSPEDEENPFSTMFDLERIFNAAGLSALRSVGMGVQLSAEGTSGQIVAAAPESERRGLLKLFPTGEKPATPPPFVPADVVKFQRMRIDGTSAWEALRRMLTDISPDMNDSIDMLIRTANEAAQQKDPNFDLNRSLFSNLGDDFIVYEKKPKGTSIEELTSAPSLILIGSPQPEQLANGLRAVFALLSEQASNPQEREFLGRKIYTIPVPTTPLAAQRASGNLSYAATAGYLAFSTDPSTLEEFLRHADGEQKQLRERSGFMDAIARAGGGSTGWLTFEDQAETTRTSITLLKKSESAEPQMLAPGIPAFAPVNPFKEWADFALLPDFDRIAKYFSFVVMTGQADAERITFRFFTPTPPELRK